MNSARAPRQHKHNRKNSEERGKDLGSGGLSPEKVLKTIPSRMLLNALSRSSVKITVMADLSIQKEKLI